MKECQHQTDSRLATRHSRERGSHCAQYIDVKYIENKKEKKGATNVERKKEE